jgi:AraC-like DNA-binding protein
MNVNIGCLKDYCPEHKHKYCEIIIYTKGTGFLKTDNLQIPFSRGTIIIVPPNTSHCSVSQGPYERIYVAGNLDRIINVSDPIHLSGDKDDDGMILAQLIYQNRYKNPDYLSSLIHAFLSYVLQSVKINDRIDEEINTIINKITHNFSDCNIDLSGILKNSGYAEDYIRDRFKKATGKTPIRFLTEIRIHHACLLIDFYKNSISLSEIAEKCGYTDYVYFSRRFKEITGVSPRKHTCQG